MTVHARGYEPMNPIRRDVAERWLASGDPAKILRALLRLSLHGPDFAYAERKAIEYANHPDRLVRYNAATALSHVARVHGSVDLNAVMLTLLHLANDPDIADNAEFSLDEVEHYMKADRRQYARQRKTAAG